MHKTPRRQRAELQVAKDLSNAFGYKVVRVDKFRRPHVVGKQRLLPWSIAVYYEQHSIAERLKETDHAAGPPYERYFCPKGNWPRAAVFYKSNRQPWRVAMFFADWLDQAAWGQCGLYRSMKTAAQGLQDILDECRHEVVIHPGKMIDLHNEDWFASMRGGPVDPTVNDWPKKG